MVPAIFLTGDDVVKGLSGTLTLLTDAGYDEIEAMRWLFTADDTLPGTPAQALAENRAPRSAGAPRPSPSDRCPRPLCPPTTCSPTTRCDGGPARSGPPVPVH